MANNFYAHPAFVLFSMYKLREGAGVGDVDGAGLCWVQTGACTVGVRKEVPRAGDECTWAV